jgi:hypothetical protein
VDHFMQGAAEEDRCDRLLFCPLEGVKMGKRCKPG